MPAPRVSRSGRRGRSRRLADDDDGTELGDFEGMIFPYDGTRAQSFWMKNTPLSLDIIYVGPDNRISNIAAETEPYSLDPVYSVGPVLGVLELRGGRAAELGIEPGDRVEW